MTEVEKDRIGTKKLIIMIFSMSLFCFIGMMIFVYGCYIAEEQWVTGMIVATLGVISMPYIGSKVIEVFCLKKNHKAGVGHVKMKLNRSERKLMKARAERIWIENNSHIHILNYPFYKLIRWLKKPKVVA